MKKLINKLYKYSFFENIRFIIWYNEYMISNIFSKKMRKKRQNLKKNTDKYYTKGKYLIDK